MKSLVICGSTKFIKEINDWVKKLKEAGVTLYHPENLRFNHDSSTDFYYAVAGATYGYFQKIRKADVVLIFNKDGYMGISATLELGYAVALAKPILSLEKDTEDEARDVLFDQQIKDVDELISYLHN